LWIEPVSAAPLAALADLLAQSQINANECIVCIMSGAGFKDTHLAEAEAELVGQQGPLPFDVAAIAAQVGQ
jgi:threonine synthase